MRELNLAGILTYTSGTDLITENPLVALNRTNLVVMINGAGIF